MVAKGVPGNYDGGGPHILSLQNIPELRTYTTLQGTVLGQSYSFNTTWSVEYLGTL